MVALRFALPVLALAAATAAHAGALRDPDAPGDAAAASESVLHDMAHPPSTYTAPFLVFERVTPVNDVFNGSTIDGHALPTWFGFVFNITLICIGLMEVVAGYRFFRYTLMLLGAIAGGVPVFLLTWDNIQGPNAFWFGVGTGAMAGLIAAVASFFLWKVGVFLIGAALGVVIALVLNVTVLYKLSPADANLPLEIGGVVLGLAFGGLALKFMRTTVVVSTAVVGAYAFVRGVGHFAGGYPSNEFDVEQELQNGQVNLPYTVYIYFAAWCILWMLGIAVQFLVTAKKVGSGKDENEKQFDEALDPLDVVLGESVCVCAARAVVYLLCTLTPPPPPLTPHPPSAGKSRRGKKSKKGKRKDKGGKGGSDGGKKAGGGGGKGGKAPPAAASSSAKRSGKVDALLRDYEAGGEYYEGGDDGGAYDEEGGGYADVEYGEGGYGEEEEYGYDMPTLPPAAAAKGRSMFGGFGRGGGGGGAGGGAAKKQQPASVDW